MEKVVTDTNIKEVLASAPVVLVDFWAVWCGPCKMLAPVVEQIANEHSEIKVGKVNVDDEPELAAKYGISSIPTIIVFKNGEAANRSVGFVAKERLEALL